MKALDLLASGIHDAKNQLFSAESLIAAAETAHGIDLGEIGRASCRERVSTIV